MKFAFLIKQKDIENFVQNSKIMIKTFHCTQHKRSILILLKIIWKLIQNLTFYIMNMLRMSNNEFEWHPSNIRGSLVFSLKRAWVWWEEVLVLRIGWWNGITDYVGAYCGLVSPQLTAAAFSFHFLTEIQDHIQESVFLIKV